LLAVVPRVIADSRPLICAPQRTGWPPGGNGQPPPESPMNEKIKAAEDAVITWAKIGHHGVKLAIALALLAIGIWIGAHL
jgi:hypothetical protein